MKTLLTSTLLCLSTTLLHAQTGDAPNTQPTAVTATINSAPTITAAQYRKRAIWQTAVGASLAGIGAAVILISAADQSLASEDFLWDDGVPNEIPNRTGEYIAGAASVIGGIVLLSMASQNRKKAKAATAVVIGMQKTTAIPFAAIPKSFPAVGLTLTF